MNDPVDLNLVRTFLEVARIGSVTAAADGLRLSQPAVSHRLRALEADLGVTLFEPHGRGLRLTEHGRRLRAEGADLIARAQHVRERVTGLGEDEGDVTIGTLPTVAAHLLVPVLTDVLRDRPRVRVSFEFDYVPALLRRLRAGELDMLIVIGEVDDDDLSVHRLGAAALGAVLASDVAPRRRAITPAWLRKRRYIAFGGASDPTFDEIARFVRRHRLADRFTPRIPHIETLRALAGAGAGYALLPTYTARRDVVDGRVAVRRVEGLDATPPVSLVHRQPMVDTPVLRATRTAIADGVRLGD